MWAVASVPAVKRRARSLGCLGRECCSEKKSSSPLPLLGFFLDVQELYLLYLLQKCLMWCGHLKLATKNAQLKVNLSLVPCPSS